MLRNMNELKIEREHYHEYNIDELINILKQAKRKGAIEVYFTEEYDDCDDVDGYLIKFRGN